LKLFAGLVLGVALASGPAMAQVDMPKATFTPGGGYKPKPAPSSSYGVPMPKPGATMGRTPGAYGPPAPASGPETFKPYQPYKPASVFGPADPKKKR